MRTWLMLTVGLLLISAANHGWGAEANSPPNIVLIFIDDLGYGDITPFGAKNVKTPHLEQLAAEGMKFTSFYATPVCTMSRTCLLTGCYNARVSMPGVLFPYSDIGLNPEEITLAEVVKQKGYATACIGKWHLGHLEPFLPTKQGFDEYFGIPYSNDMAIDPKHARFAKDCVFRDGMTAEKAREKAIRHTVPLMRGEEIVEYPADQATLTERYTDEAVKFIRAHRDEPFFVYLPHTMVHIPLAASEKFRGKSGHGLLGDAIEELDTSIGVIMQTLKELKIDDKTLVIFTSDNGAAVGSSLPWRGKKGSNFEGGVREPCIMRWPGKIPAGKTCNQIAGNIDMLPTFAKLVGAKLDESVTRDGNDISSLMFNDNATPVRDTHLYYTARQSLAAIRQGDWKLFVVKPDEQGRKVKPAQGNSPRKELSNLMLFNLAEDPAETTNVAAEHPEIVAKLQKAATELSAEIEKNRRPVGKLATP